MRFAIFIDNAVLLLSATLKFVLNIINKDAKKKYKQLWIEDLKEKNWKNDVIKIKKDTKSIIIKAFLGRINVSIKLFCLSMRVMRSSLMITVIKPIPKNGTAISAIDLCKKSVDAEYP